MSHVMLSKEQVEEICAHLEETASMIGAPLDKTKESMVNLEGILLSLKGINGVRSCILLFEENGLAFS